MASGYLHQGVVSITDEKSMKKTISPENNMMLTNKGHTKIQFRKEQHLN